MSRDQQIDQLCDEFERAWRADQQPRIEDYLQHVPQQARRAALRELLATEIELYKATGRELNVTEYRERFPEEPDLVEAVIREMDTAQVDLSLEPTHSARGTDASAAPEVEDPVPERIGQFVIEDVLGKGGFGRVYRARDTQLNRQVAIKGPSPGYWARVKQQLRERFEQEGAARILDEFLDEARKAAGLKHPGLVTVYEFRIEDERPYIVQELIDGCDLARWAKNEKPDQRQIARLTVAIAEALGYAHQQGFVHRDLKPANVLIDPDGHPHITDFGLALHESVQLARAGERAGTLPYMSPEQVRGEAHRLDGRTDLWSLGVMLYELLVGRLPFVGEVVDLIQQIERADPRPPRQRRPEVAAELERICLKCLEKRRSDRYSSAAALIDDLQHWLDQGAPSRPPSAPEPEAKNESESSAPAHIVPKGLRSFDEHDADFFLELLPGPSDREGLPENIRFWKTRIEEMDPDQTFSVGLIYGPSGCGKSSLVKAGLLPRVSRHVACIYVEATPDDTELRLLKGLKKQLPSVPDADLPEMLLRLRERGAGRGRKVLIVLDQFEQWLHAHGSEDNTQLVDALRHCDGGNLQCIVMVRDDFWLAASRFMRALEIRLREAENSGLVDLFDKDHARKVLTAFGQAYGKVPPSPAEPTEDQQRFVEGAVDALAQENKVISVRLALFAEMMKSRPWTPDALQEGGGTEGVGVTFLEETFSASTAPPQHRLHQRAARRVLTALLPESGTDIKGHMRSREELLEASSYGQRPGDFADLLRILDTELRLITPTDPEGAQAADDEADAQYSPDQQYYQLTHDYLVPSLRRWLTQKQRETRRGRAELRLAERAALWNNKPERRHLPSAWEFLSITALTNRKQWSEPQKRMMRTARRMHGIHAGVITACLLLLLAGGAAIRSAYKEDKARVQAATLVDGLLSANIEDVARFVEQLDDYRAWADPLLREMADTSEVGSREKLHASLALLPVEEARAEYLTERLKSAEAQQARVLAAALEPHKQQLIEPLWELLDQQLSKDSPHAVLPAAAALAHFAPEDPRWEAAAPLVANTLVAVSPVHLADWVDVLRPLENQLTDPLTAVYQNAKDQYSETEVRLATSVLADYAGDDLQTLSELVVTAQPDQFRTVFPMFASQGAAAEERMTAELNRELQHDWKDPPLDPAWASPDEQAVERIEAAGGMVAERLAFCQTLPLEDFREVAEALRSAGFRPTRVRPYVRNESVQVAAVWKRDGQQWQLASGMTAEELYSRDEEIRGEGFLPTDVGGYVAKSPENASDRYLAVWAKIPRKPETRLYAGVSASQQEELDEQLSSAGFSSQSSIQAFCNAGGDLSYCGIRASGNDGSITSSDLTAAEYVETHNQDRFLWDVDLSTAGESPTTEVRYTAQLAALESMVEQRPHLKNDPTFLQARATAHFYLGKNEQALADLNAAAELHESADPDLVMRRAMVHARLGNAEKAKEDLQQFEQLAAGPEAESTRLYLAVVVAATLGDPAGELEKLEAAIAAHAQDTNFLYNTACAYALSAAAAEEASQAAGRRARAVELLRQAVRAGWSDFAHLQADPDLDPLRQYPPFQELLRENTSNVRYAAVWQKSAEFEATELHGISPVQHREQARSLITEGWRPVSWTAVANGANAGLLTASVWHRPRISTEARTELVARQANAAVALIKLGQTERSLPLLVHQEDPSLRSAIIHRLQSSGVSAGVLAEALTRPELEPSIRQGLLLALGDFALRDVPEASRESLIERLTDWYATDPSSGVHSATGWLLRRWGFDEAVARVDRTPLPYDEQREWFVMGIDVPNPEAEDSGKHIYFTMIVFPPGEFTMGHALGRDNPPHRVRLTRPIAVSDRETTWEQFDPFDSGGHRTALARNSSKQLAGDQPAYAVHWFEAAAYCRWLTEQAGMPEGEQFYSAALLKEDQDDRPGWVELPDSVQWPINREGRGFRLLTEAEWERVCRSGTRTGYSFGDDTSLLGHYGWYLENSGDWMRPTGLLRPNPRGLFDIHGNLYEWCHDYWNGGRFGSDVTDPLGPEESSSRVARGGSWGRSFGVCRSSSRISFVPSNRHVILGFRVALVPSAGQQQASGSESESRGSERAKAEL